MDELHASGVTKFLMVVAVVAVVVAGINVVVIMNNLGGTGYAASDSGNITLEIQQIINLNFSRNIINWTSGYVNTTCGSGLYSMLDTNNTATPVYCGSLWQPVNRGLIITTAGTTLPIAINLSSDKNALTLLDGGVVRPLPSWFRWKIQEYNNNDVAEFSTCDGTLAPTTYTDIVAGQQIRICNQTQYNLDRDELRIDFQLNVSVQAPALQGYRIAIITATGWLPP